MTKLMTIDSVLVRDFSRFGLLTTFLKLSSKMQTSSTACDCIKIPSGISVYDSPEPGKLYMAALTNEEFGKALELGTSFRGLTCDDSTVLFLARRDETVLITGDSFVYRVAVSLHIKVHNYEWAFAEMVEAGLLGRIEAREKSSKLSLSVNKFTDWKAPALALNDSYADHKNILNYSSK